MMMVISLKRFRRRAVPVIEAVLTVSVAGYIGFMLYRYLLG